jgi:hypothetical protein
MRSQMRVHVEKIQDFRRCLTDVIICLDRFDLPQKVETERQLKGNNDLIPHQNETMDRFDIVGINNFRKHTECLLNVRVHIHFSVFRHHAKDHHEQKHASLRASIAKVDLPIAVYARRWIQEGIPTVDF